MKLDIYNLQGIIYVLAPFIIICYFLLSSLINVDLKGIIYLIGLTVGTILTVFIGNGFVGKNDNQNQKQEMCSLITINHIAGISNIPISLTVYSFTSAYLLYTVSATNYILPNIIPLLFFSVLILGDMIWLSSNHCFSSSNIIISFVLASLFGVCWGFAINKTQNKSLQYFTGDDAVCTMPKKRTFKCKRANKSLAP